MTEFITGRDIDACPGDDNAGTSGYSTGQALNNEGVARMDIYDSEIACEAAVTMLACFATTGMQGFIHSPIDTSPI